MPTSRQRKAEAADPTTVHARAIVDGRIIAGELVRHAAERHLRDLVDGPKRGLVWRPDRAAHAINFFPAVLQITAGAYEGRPFHLLPWHLFCAGNLFGWLRADGKRRFREGWLETGKGQAKSPFMAAIGLYLMGFLDIARAEIYAIAWDKNQANVLFRDAVAMCRAPIPGHEDEEVPPTLETRGDIVIRGTHDNAWKIEHLASSSKFQSLANSGTISGPRPIGVLADEVHEFKDAGLIETWKRAIEKMPGDALMLLGTNTPSSAQLVGTAYSERFQKVVRGEFQDDSLFAYIARVDKDDDPFNDESCWIKALPALGITYPIENIRQQVNSARLLTSTQMSVKRLSFGIAVGSIEFWIAEEAWAAVQGRFDIAELKGRPCWLSLDLSQKNDLTALTVVWIGADGCLYAKTWYWTTKDGLAERTIADQAPYEAWVQDGYITAVPGSVIDKSFVAARVAEIVAEHDVQFLAFDPAGMADFMKACEQIGFPVWRYLGPGEPEGIGLKLVAHAQGTRVLFEDKQLCMPRSIEHLEDKILEGMIVIEESPVTYSCAANALVVSDGQNNRAFDKRRSRGRIDGLVTIAMGVGAAEMATPRKAQSFWEALPPA